MPIHRACDHRDRSREHVRGSASFATRRPSPAVPPGRSLPFPSASRRPFVPKLPHPLKRQTVATMPSPMSLVAMVGSRPRRPPRPRRPTAGDRAPSPRSAAGRRPVPPRLKRAATMLVVMGLAAGGVYVSQRFQVLAPPPDAWDPRVATLVAFVETERGLHSSTRSPSTSCPRPSTPRASHRTAPIDAEAWRSSAPTSSTCSGSRWVTTRSRATA